ncbi:MAG TPA: serine/threonine-protein kinase, partial [Candidatus Cloacimonadota bacterium]|nr:serine/threonine-protein kinase [Candidatus Cloacimonadota bacterium]
MIIDSRYQVITNLGTGLYASVFKVRDIRTDQIYSLKLFNHLEAGAFYEELNAESMHHITKLRHPNLLHIYNFGNWDTHIYYLAEFYQGTNLKNFRFNPQKYSMLYDLIVQIVYALDALHNQNILHKDIKPENIMYSIVDQKIRIKVLDYGFNKMDTERNQQRISGTLPYIAPEIYAGESGSPESDFYALGVTLYYILTQTLPFSQDQISEIIQGEYKNFFPKFIRNFVPDIPIELEKFVLKLIEKKPEDRFPNCHAIIQYINKIQKKRYLYTQKQATINFFKYGSYLVRNEYSNQLKGFVENIVQKNGKLITIIGGEGLGKGDILTLFKYSILNNNYYIFDYVCSTQNRDPFFALIKEFSSSALSNERKQIESSLISEKLKIYLEKSEIEASKLNETKDNLMQDFEYSKQFLMNLSEEKPLIFIIRNGQHLTEHTLEFLNHIAPEINNLPVMIIVSINDPEKIKKLKYAVRIMMKTLTPADTHDYLQKILRSDVTQDFSQELWDRTNGNPQFIVGILSDLIENKKLITDDKIHFDIDLSKYQLPEKIIHSIYKRMSHLSAVSYRYLQKLSCIHTPLNMELIMEMLQISKRTLYNLLSDAISNEILYKEGGVYKFNFREVKERFFNECPDFIKVDISNKLIEYHKSSANLDKETIKGLLLNCLITKDYESLLLFKRQLYKLYNSDYEQHNAFNEIYEILELTLSDKAPLRESDFRADLLSLICKAELTGSIEKAYNLVSSIKNKDNIFEYHFVLAALNMRLESFEKALELYQKSYNLAISGKQQTIALLDMVWIHIFKGEKAQAQSIIEQLSQYQLTNDLEVCFNDRKGLFISKFHNEEDAIEFLEEYLPKIQATNDQRIINRLSSLYSNLGNLYSNTKRYTEASKYYKLAQSLSEKINNQNQLSTIYNNIGDFYLKQGMTNNALDYFNKGKNLSKKLNNIRNLTLANVNFGEAYIKLGDFISAETYLEKARELSENSKNKNFYDSIMSNLATTKNKLYSFKEYLEFIEKEHLFELFDKKKSITPFHKTYIYYLCEVMQIEKVSEFLNANLKPSNTNNDEFLYQVKGIINLHKKEYQLAKANFEKSLAAANQIKSIYALTICYIRLAECNLKMNNINEAEENIKNAKIFVETHQFKYWGAVIQILKLQISLLRKETPLRSLLRQTIILNEKCEENRYHILNIDCLGLITQIYKELKATNLYKSNFNKYMTKVKDMARGIPDNEYKSYIAYRLPVQTPQQHLQLYQVTPRAKKDHESWQKELFALLRKDVINEIHYILEKFIKDNFAPQKYTIIYSKKSVSYDMFLSHSNFAIYVSSGIRETELEAYQQICINALNKRAVEKDTIDGKHVMVAPLWLRKSCYGCLIIEDNGELAFTNHETHTMEMFSIQLSALLIRVLEYENNEKTIKKMQEVMNLSKR